MEGGECQEDSQADSTGDAEKNLHAVGKKKQQLLIKIFPRSRGKVAYPPRSLCICRKLVTLIRVCSIAEGICIVSSSSPEEWRCQHWRQERPHRVGKVDGVEEGVPAAVGPKGEAQNSPAGVHRPEGGALRINGILNRETSKKKSAGIRVFVDFFVST